MEHKEGQLMSDQGVKRYALPLCNGRVLAPQEREQGYWVPYNDYDTMKTRLEGEIAELSRPDVIAYLKAKIRRKGQEKIEQVKTITRLYEFVRNGIEYGYIKRPARGDPANETIDAAFMFVFDENAQP